MSLTVLDKPSLWSLSEAARLLGLAEVNGRRVVARLVQDLEIETKPMSNNGKGLTRADLERLSKVLDRRL